MANFLKHRELKPPRSVTLTAAIKPGSFSNAFSRGFDIGGLELIVEDGSKLSLEDVIHEALAFWEHFFQENGLMRAESQEP
ncbi:MAG: hypothetical protein OXG37_04685 [Actinomycetia bacterium]|nr:hypothetical protein [Actinomycetes bacterium]